MIDINDTRLNFIPIPEGIPNYRYLSNYVKHYWIFVEDKGILFWKAGKHFNFMPQCSSDKAIVEHLRDNQYPWAEIKFLDNVLLPMDLHGNIELD